MNDNVYVDFFCFQVLCNVLATSKTFKHDSLMVICEGIVVFLNFSWFGTWRSSNSRKYFTITFMSAKLKLKIRVPGWHDPSVMLPSSSFLIYLVYSTCQLSLPVNKCHLMKTLPFNGQALFFPGNLNQDLTILSLTQIFQYIKAISFSWLLSSKCWPHTRHLVAFKGN